jgi:hypothetical protein
VRKTVSNEDSNFLQDNGGFMVAESDPFLEPPKHVLASEAKRVERGVLDPADLEWRTTGI